MPIPINLLAEAQAAEELRRRDPVKRGIWIGGFLVCLVGLWIAKLQLDIFFESKNVAQLKERWTENEGKNKKIVENQKQIALVESKLAGLDRLATNRFLWGSALNALQHTIVNQIQVTRVRTEQSFVNESAVPSKKIPAALIEKSVLSIEAKDWNPSGLTYNTYKETLSNDPYFVKHLGRRDGFTLAGTVSAPGAQEGVDASRQSVAFSLEAKFPEVRRCE